MSGGSLSRLINVVTMMKGPARDGAPQALREVIMRCDVTEKYLLYWGRETV